MILTNITTSTTVPPFGRVVNIVNQNQDAREARIYPLIPHRSQTGAGGTLANPIKPASPVFPIAREVALGRFLLSWILFWSWFLAGGGAEFWMVGGKGDVERGEVKCIYWLLNVPTSRYEGGIDLFQLWSVRGVYKGLSIFRYTTNQETSIYWLQNILNIPSIRCTNNSPYNMIYAPRVWICTDFCV